jgi:multiple sugar transport system substrate-binding protein
MISAVTSGVVPDIMEVADFDFAPLQTWAGRLLDVSDIVETQKSKFNDTALANSHFYNNETKKRAYYQVPWKSAAVPFRFWKSLVEKSGRKLADVPQTWDAFVDFFMPVQDGLRKRGLRDVYAYGYQLTESGVDPINTFNAFMIAYGGENFVTPQGELQTSDPKIREAAIKATAKLAKSFTDGYVPPSVLNWNDADDNNAFRSKRVVMDFDGSLSTEVAVYHDKAEYDDIKTYGLPLGNDGQKLPAQVFSFGVVIPKGAKNVPLAKEFMAYCTEPKVLNTYLKASLGRWVIPMPALARSDPFWLKEDQHRTALTEMTLFGPTIPVYEAYNPGMAPVGAENALMTAVINVMKNGMTPAAAIDQAFKRVEAVVAKYPVAAS